MKIVARVRNAGSEHDVTVCTAGRHQTLPVSAKATRDGSAVNGGEFLMLALATCYCNDLYREAQRLAIELHGVEVEASADFDGIGLAARDVGYCVRIESAATPAQVEQLLAETDAVAEVHNTLRTPTAVTRRPWPPATQ